MNTIIFNFLRFIEWKIVPTIKFSVLNAIDGDTILMNNGTYFIYTLQRVKCYTFFILLSLHKRTISYTYTYSYYINSTSFAWILNSCFMKLRNVTIFFFCNKLNKHFFMPKVYFTRTLAYRFLTIIVRIITYITDARFRMWLMWRFPIFVLDNMRPILIDVFY